MLTLTSLTIWHRWEQAVSGGSGFAGSSKSGLAHSSGSGFAGSKPVAAECSLSPLTIWLRLEQAVRGGSSFAGSSGSGFAGSSGILSLTSLTICLHWCNAGGINSMIHSTRSIPSKYPLILSRYRTWYWTYTRTNRWFTSKLHSGAESNQSRINVE